MKYGLVVAAPVVIVHGTGAVTKAAGVIIAAVGHVIVYMTARQGAVLHSAQRKARAVAIAAPMVVSAIHGAVMHMTASKGAALDRADGNHSLLNLGVLPAVADRAMMAAMGGGRSDQCTDSHKTYGTGEKDSLDSHSRGSPFKIQKIMLCVRPLRPPCPTDKGRNGAAGPKEAANRKGKRTASLYYGSL